MMRGNRARMSRWPVGQGLPAQGSLIGAWYIDQFKASPRPLVPNAAQSVAASANLLSAPRRMFVNPDWWGPGTLPAVDSTVTAPDGTLSASTLNATGNWAYGPAKVDTIPAGTYTLAINVKSNTGTNQQFCLSQDNTGTRSPVKTATTVWQRFSYTFTLGASSNINRLVLCSIDGVTAANLQICDFECYSGSVDLGPQGYAGHLYLGSSAFDTRPSYASGALDLSAVGYGLIQFLSNQTLTTFTVQALVSKVAAASAYHSILSQAQSFGTFSVWTEQNTVPNASINSSNPVAPAQNTGLWVALGKGYHVITARYDGTKFDYWLDDVRILSNTIALSAVAVADLFVNITNAASLSGGNKFAGAIALWNAALTDGDVRSAVSFQQTRAAASLITASNASRVLVAEGDSITGFFTYSYPYLFGPNASPALYGVNYAVSGSNLANVIARAPIVDAIIPPNTTGRKFIYSLLIGANDGGYAGGPTQYAADLATYLDARRAKGWKVVLCTLLPQTNTAGFNTFRNAVNTIIYSWTVGQHYDALCDFAANATMGIDSSFTSFPADWGDTIHPNAAGMPILEPIYRAAVNSL